MVKFSERQWWMVGVRWDRLILSSIRQTASTELRSLLLSSSFGEIKQACLNNPGMACCGTIQTVAAWTVAEGGLRTQEPKV
jgi:hypothetical protein